MKASIITIGDELLIGQVIDTNAAWISQSLFYVGIPTLKKTSVGDTLENIVEVIRDEFKSADLVLLTGGIGPTKDDITKKALAQYYQCGMEFSEETYRRIEIMFAKRNIPLSASHKAQCFMPAKARLLKNKLGSAPAMWFEEKNKVLVSMPGVPHEMKHIMEEQVLPVLQAQTHHYYVHKTIHTVGMGESVIADMIEPTLEGHLVKCAYLPSQGQVRIRLTVEGGDKNEAQVRLDSAIFEVTRKLGNRVFGFDGVKLEAILGELLLESGWSIGMAESCTGGYLAHLFTAIPGASRYFQGSVVAYSNDLKQNLLQVRPQTLTQHGAVSKMTAEEMVRGTLANLKTDLAVAVTGIAGPDGGTKEKPVGTVWISVGNKNNMVSKRFLFTKDRLINIKYTANYAMDMIRNFIIGE